MFTCCHLPTFKHQNLTDSATSWLYSVGARGKRNLLPPDPRSQERGAPADCTVQTARPPGRVWRMLVCLCVHREIMKWLLKGLGQVNWQDRDGTTVKIVFKQSISQYLWYLGDTFLLFKDQSVVLASAHSVKKDHL